MNQSSRSRVIVLGPNPIDKKEFERRRLTIDEYNLEDLSDDLLNQARGIVLSEFPGKRRIAAEYLSGPFHRACEYGLITRMISSDETDRNYFVKHSEEVRKKWQCKGPCLAVPWTGIEAEIYEVAEIMARHDSGPQIGDVQIKTLDAKLELSTDVRLLLKRAFSDCDEILVDQLQGGRSAKETYRVFATLSGPLYGPQPLPFFVKVGTPAAMEREMANYQQRAEPFVPFHLRPTLNFQRCVKSVNWGMLVCNFVGCAVPLRVAWHKAQGTGTIFSLFEFTLRGLRAGTGRGELESGNLVAFLSERIRAREIAENQHGAVRIRRAEELGLSRSPEAVEQLLQREAAKILSRRGTYHGDLHCGNIMVRHRDAIVIDFGSLDLGPITADPAFLEVSLIFDVDDEDDPSAFEPWKELVDALFGEPLQPPVHDAEHMRFAWLREAVRELRHVVSCCGAERNEALIVLAGCLLRYARLSRFESLKPELIKLSEDRRAYALVVAERIASMLGATDEES